jgi:hypothetical protein
MSGVTGVWGTLAGGVQERYIHCFNSDNLPKPPPDVSAFGTKDNTDNPAADRIQLLP